MQSNNYWNISKMLMSEKLNVLVTGLKYISNLSSWCITVSLKLTFLHSSIYVAYFKIDLDMLLISTNQLGYVTDINQSTDAICTYDSSAEKVSVLTRIVKCDKSNETYSSSCNLTQPISRILIGRHVIFCLPTWPKCCSSPRKCTPVKYNARQKSGFQILTYTTSEIKIIPLNC